MKIAFINENWTAGASRCARDLEAAFAKQGSVLYFPRYPKESVETLWKGLTDFQPEVVHLHSYYGSFPYSFFNEVSHRYPTCFTVHDLRPIGDIELACWDCAQNHNCRKCPLVSRIRKTIPFLNRYYKSRRHKKKDNLKVDCKAVLIAPSQWMEKKLAASELSRLTIRHIPNGIDTSLYRKREGARQELGLSPKAPILFYAAHRVSDAMSLHERKGLAYLAAAFVNDVVKEFPESRLLVAGDSFVPNHPNVIPLGEIPSAKMPVYYSAANIFVSPTLGDNLPFTILEAMSCETAVVASSVGGVSELVDSQTGVLVPPRDSESLAMAITTLLSSNELRMKMGEQARKKVMQIYSMELFVEKMRLVYEGLGASSARKVA